MPRERLHPKRRNHERKPKVFANAFNAGLHFDPYFDREKMERDAHQQGLEAKFFRNRRREKVLTHEVETQPASRAPVTLPKLKWGSNEQG